MIAMAAVGAAFKAVGGAFAIAGALKAGDDAYKDAKTKVMLMQYNLVGRQAELGHQSSLLGSEASATMAQLQEMDNIRQNAVKEASASIASSFVGRGVSVNSESFAAVESSMQRQAEEEAALDRMKAGRQVSLYRMQQDELRTASANEYLASDVEQQATMLAGKRAQRASRFQAVSMGLQTAGSMVSSFGGGG